MTHSYNASAIAQLDEIPDFDIADLLSGVGSLVDGSATEAKIKETRVSEVAPEIVDKVAAEAPGDSKPREIGKAPTKKDAKVRLAAEAMSNDIKRRAKELEENDLQVSFDDHLLTNNRNKYKRFILEPSMVCGVFDGRINTQCYIASIGIIPYNPYNKPIGLVQDPAQQLVAINRLGELFGYEFLKSVSGTLSFQTLDEHMCKFILQNRANCPTTKFSYDFIKNMLTKLLLCSVSSIEYAFKSPHFVQIQPAFKKYISRDIAMMQMLPEELRASFNIFATELCDIRNGKIFTTTSPNTLYKICQDIQEHNYIAEELLACSIKCFTPAFAVDYFDVVRCIYILATYFNIYFANPKNLSKSVPAMRDDLRLIAMCVNIIYENGMYLQTAVPRSMPQSKTELSDQTKLYYLDHLLNGPQYYILKNIQEMFPIIADHIAPTKSE